MLNADISLLFDNDYDAQKKASSMYTVSGQIFHPFDPDYQAMHIDDIAHSLGMLCRWGGHVPRFFSVAEHSVLASETIQKWAGGKLNKSTFPAIKWALLHDASEGYMVDIPRPIKKFMPIYVETENAIQDQLKIRFDMLGMTKLDETFVHAIDDAMLWFEKDGFGWQDRQWTMPVPEMYDVSNKNGWAPTLKHWTPEVAKHKFMERFTELQTYAEAQSHT